MIWTSICLMESNGPNRQVLSRCTPAITYFIMLPMRSVSTLYEFNQPVFARSIPWANSVLPTCMLEEADELRSSDTTMFIDLVVRFRLLFTPFHPAP